MSEPRASRGVESLTRLGSGGRVSTCGWAGHSPGGSLPSKTKARREVGLAAYDLDASSHFGIQASWRIAKTVVVSGGRPPGPPRSPPRRLWAGRIHWTGCHLARFVFRLTSAGGSCFIAARALKAPRSYLFTVMPKGGAFSTKGWGCDIR